MTDENLLPIIFGIALILITAGCGSPPGSQAATTATESAPSVGQSGVKDSDSKPSVVQVAVGSPDHATLVAALQAASYADVFSNVGPFTVFAPTNAAFDLLSAGTVENLVKPAESG